jgi:hypothetical protein
LRPVPLYFREIADQATRIRYRGVCCRVVVRDNDFAAQSRLALVRAMALDI